LPFGLIYEISAAEKEPATPQLFFLPMLLLGTLHHATRLDISVCRCPSSPPNLQEDLTIIY